METKVDSSTGQQPTDIETVPAASLSPDYRARARRALTSRTWVRVTNSTLLLTCVILIVAVPSMPYFTDTFDLAASAVLLSCVGIFTADFVLEITTHSAYLRSPQGLLDVVVLTFGWASLAVPGCERLLVLKLGRFLLPPPGWAVAPDAPRRSLACAALRAIAIGVVADVVLGVVGVEIVLFLLLASLLASRHAPPCAGAGARARRYERRKLEGDGADTDDAGAGGMCGQLLLVVLGLAAGTHLLYMAVGWAAAEPLWVPTDASRFDFEGRWRVEGGVALADWPCSTVRFRVRVKSRGGAKLRLLWRSTRVRLLSTTRRVDRRAGMVGNATAVSVVFSGPPVYVFGMPPAADELHLGEGLHELALHKLTGGAPYNMGVGAFFTAPSRLEFRGVALSAGDAELVPWAVPQAPKRMVQIIGASDSTGWCADGSKEDEDSTSSAVQLWRRTNCHSAAVPTLARRLRAAVSVQGLAGSGLMQNANAATPWLFGPLTMAQLHLRTLLSDARSEWTEERAALTGRRRPDLIIVSLGGNDFNHQVGHAPSAEKFGQAYSRFLASLFTATAEGDAHAPPGLVVVSICGQGSPADLAFDPDNNRCRPCPNVEAAVHTFRRERPSLATRVHYVFVPCDGSVVREEHGSGCQGHMTPRGQAAVADFLVPRVAKIMQWGEGADYDAGSM